MSRGPQRLPDYLGHILEAIERIQRYVRDIDEVGFHSPAAPLPLHRAGDMSDPDW